MKEVSTIIYYQYKPNTWLALLFSTQFLVVGDEGNWPEEPYTSPTTEHQWQVSSDASLYWALTTHVTRYLSPGAKTVILKDLKSTLKK